MYIVGSWLYVLTEAACTEAVGTPALVLASCTNAFAKASFLY